MIEEKVIKGAIFDIDGTILDSMPIWHEIGVRYLNSMEIQPEENLSKILFPMTFYEGAAYLQQHYRIEKEIDEIILDIKKIMADFYYYEVHEKDGVRELLECLNQQGIIVTVATSGERNCVEAALERLGLLQYVAKIFISDEVGVGKEFPDIYLKAAEYIGAKPEEIWVFEDALYAVRTASAAGFQTVGVYDAASEDHQEELQEAADRYIKSFSDFECRI